MRPVDRPDVVAGAQVHAIVATPSDSPDLFAAEANKLADDVASISAWWAGQDPTRMPRYDLATFPGGTCLDISFVRLPLPTSAYQGASTAFNAVRNELEDAGFANAYKDYVVYYDGPSVEEDVCGTGAGAFDQGAGFAVVLAQRLPRRRHRRRPGARAAARLWRAAGRSAERVYARDGPVRLSSTPVIPATRRPTSSTRMTDDGPLQQKVLDFNHDDYYAHSGSWIDIQDTIFLHRLDVPQVPLAVALSGAGNRRRATCPASTAPPPARRNGIPGRRSHSESRRQRACGSSAGPAGASDQTSASST